MTPASSPEPGPLHGPPWAIVIHLPDDTPPADVFARFEHAARVFGALPDGSQVTAFGGPAARAVLDAAQPPEET